MTKVVDPVWGDRAVLAAFDFAAIQATFTPVPTNMRFRDFVRTVLPQRWTSVHRVRLGKRDDLNPIEIASWCASNSDRWCRSPGHEVYYFDDAHAAFHFKLRWVGAPGCNPAHTI